MLYFEDYASLRSSLNSDELVSVLDAMTSYSETGCLPDEYQFSPAAKICWRFMKPKMDRDSQNYQNICAKRADAANKRWNATASNDNQNANACKCINSMQNQQEQNFMPTTTTTATATTTAAATIPHDYASPAPDDDLSAQIEAHQHADDLIRRYKLPDSDMSREALLEDAEKVGFDRLEEVLKQASLSNNRQGLSVNFYRSVLNSNGKRKEACSFENTYGEY